MGAGNKLAVEGGKYVVKKAQHVSDDRLRIAIQKMRKEHVAPRKYAESHGLPVERIMEMWKEMREEGGYNKQGTSGVVVAAKATTVVQIIVRSMEADKKLKPWKGSIFVILSGDATPTSRGQLTELSLRYVQGSLGLSVVCCFPIVVSGTKDKHYWLAEMDRLGNVDGAISELHGKTITTAGGEKATVVVLNSGDMMYAVHCMRGPFPNSPNRCCLWCEVLKADLHNYTTAGVEEGIPYVYAVFQNIPLSRLVPDPLHGQSTCILRMILAMVLEASSSPLFEDVLRIARETLPLPLHQLLQPPKKSGRLAAEDKYQMLGPLMDVMQKNKWKTMLQVMDLLVVQKHDGPFIYVPQPGADEVQSFQPCTEWAEAFKKVCDIAYCASPSEAEGASGEAARELQQHAWKWQALWGMLSKEVVKRHFTPWCHCACCHWSWFVDKLGTLHMGECPCLRVASQPNEG